MMPGRRERATPRTAAALYDGRDLLAIVQRHADGWHILMRGRDDLGVTLPTRAMAISLVNARHKRVPSAPIVGERESDQQRVRKVRFHQQAAREQRARGAGSNR